MSPQVLLRSRIIVALQTTQEALSLPVLVRRVQKKRRLGYAPKLVKQGVESLWREGYVQKTETGTYRWLGFQVPVLTWAEFSDPQRSWAYDPQTYHFLPVRLKGNSRVSAKTVTRFCEDNQGRTHVESVQTTAQGDLLVCFKSSYRYDPVSDTCRWHI